MERLWSIAVWWFVCLRWSEHQAKTRQK